MRRVLDVATSFAVTGARLAAGTRVGRLGPRPERPLELYEFEACPYCRKVREALSVLDLDAWIRPCPKGGRRDRRRALELGGKEQFPYLVDPNTGKALYESSEIVRYLFERYGAGPPSGWSATGPLDDASSTLAGLWRTGAGARARPSRVPEQPLELWSFEGSPFCRLVRETLCSLELPYLLHNVAHGSPRRDVFVRRAGKMQVPYLADPNTGVEMFESADIVHYLEATYAET